MKVPPTIQPTPGQGPGYDPMDRIVEDLQNIESFILKLGDDPEDLHYLDTHLSKILPLRRSISNQIDLLTYDPYAYPNVRLEVLHKLNEKIFSSLEGLVGAMQAGDETHFAKFMEAIEASISKFDENLTP